MDTRPTSRRTRLVCGVGGVALLLALVLLPRFVNFRITAYSSCVNNLREIAGAKQNWAIDFHKTTNDVPTWADLRGYFAHGELPKCPNEGAYTIGRVVDNPVCSCGAKLQ